MFQCEYRLHRIPKDFHAGDSGRLGQFSVEGSDGPAGAEGQLEVGGVVSCEIVGPTYLKDLDGQSGGRSIVLNDFEERKSGKKRRRVGSHDDPLTFAEKNRVGHLGMPKRGDERTGVADCIECPRSERHFVRVPPLQEPGHCNRGVKNKDHIRPSAIHSRMVS